VVSKIKIRISNNQRDAAGNAGKYDHKDKLIYYRHLNKKAVFKNSLSYIYDLPSVNGFIIIIKVVLTI